MWYQCSVFKSDLWHQENVTATPNPLRRWWLLNFEQFPLFLLSIPEGLLKIAGSGLI